MNSDLESKVLNAGRACVVDRFGGVIEFEAIDYKTLDAVAMTLLSSRPFDYETDEFYIFLIPQLPLFVLRYWIVYELKNKSNE